MNRSRNKKTNASNSRDDKNVPRNNSTNPNRPPQNRMNNNANVSFDGPVVPINGIYQNGSVINAFSQLLGSKVRVATKAHQYIEGIFETVGANGDVVLRLARYLPESNACLIPDSDSVPLETDFSSSKLEDTIMISHSTIVAIAAINLDMSDTQGDHGQVFFTDAQISHRRPGANGVSSSSRELEVWTDDADCPDELRGGLMEGVNAQDGWNASEMFSTNQSRFGVSSTYSPDMAGYTTPLVVDTSSENYKKAESLAAEIETQQQNSRHNDEREDEEKYSAVQREPPTNQNGKKAAQYIPPPRRQAESAAGRGSQRPLPQRFQHQPPDRGAVPGKQDVRHEKPATNGESKERSSPVEQLPVARGHQSQETRGRDSKHELNSGTQHYHHPGMSRPEPMYNSYQRSHDNRRVTTDNKDSRTHYSRDSPALREMNTSRHCEMPPAYSEAVHRHHPSSRQPPSGYPPHKDAKVGPEFGKQDRGTAKHRSKEDNQIADLKKFSNDFNLSAESGLRDKVQSTARQTQPTQQGLGTQQAAHQLPAHQQPPSHQSHQQPTHQQPHPQPTHQQPHSQPTHQQPHPQPTHQQPHPQPTHQQPHPQPTHQQPHPQPTHQQPHPQPTHQQPHPQPTHQQPHPQPTHQQPHPQPTHQQLHPQPSHQQAPQSHPQPPHQPSPHSQSHPQSQQQTPTQQPHQAPPHQPAHQAPPHQTHQSPHQAPSQPAQSHPASSHSASSHPAPSHQAPPHQGLQAPPHSSLHQATPYQSSHQTTPHQPPHQVPHLGPHQPHQAHSHQTPPQSFAAKAHPQQQGEKIAMGTQQQHVGHGEPPPPAAAQPLMQRPPAAQPPVYHVPPHHPHHPGSTEPVMSPSSEHTAPCSSPAEKLSVDGEGAAVSSNEGESSRSSSPQEQKKITALNPNAKPFVPKCDLRPPTPRQAPVPTMQPISVTHIPHPLGAGLATASVVPATLPAGYAQQQPGPPALQTALLVPAPVQQPPRHVKRPHALMSGAPPAGAVHPHMASAATFTHVPQFLPHHPASQTASLYNAQVNTGTPGCLLVSAPPPQYRMVPVLPGHLPIVNSGETPGHHMYFQTAAAGPAVPTVHSTAPAPPPTASSSQSGGQQQPPQQQPSQQAPTPSATPVSGGVQPMLYHTSGAPPPHVMSAAALQTQHHQSGGQFASGIMVMPAPLLTHQQSQQQMMVQPVTYTSPPAVSASQQPSHHHHQQPPVVFGAYPAQAPHPHQ